ncbi:adenosine monophosphate-protein transferase FICD homolog [Ceratitis capitata]|uniref:adenosine monophosphate-protein transferase FICD homolog n=1 Tax=Ceratitis capitata TaxID=7213 RepID=UPI00032A3630|nr:adenosine monophosphate-protein transferase FICD homolog [Ceratitis capitata]XP_004534426.1 adenosine monophosphate-protein transferase FICD homolog [Ceratitis capitata]
MDNETPSVWKRITRKGSGFVVCDTPTDNYDSATKNHNITQATVAAIQSNALLQLQEQQRLVRVSLLSASFVNICIFIAGTSVAFFLYEFLHFNPYSALIRQATKQLQHLPDNHFLQTRDDFAVYAAPGMGDIDLRAFTDMHSQMKEDETHDSGTNIKEALDSLKLATEMRIMGKEEKAQRLYEHAFALAPKHPEVLLRYGEYLEHDQRNILLADQYYFQALMLNPTNSEAVANRQRTAGIVQSIDERKLELLDLKRDALSAVHESNAALRRAKKEAYFQHIYHSVGIEGNTMTLAQTRSILETRMAIDGKSIDEHNEILGLDLAMKYINASLVNKIEITLRDILEIHRRVLGHVDPIEGGEFRRTQVYVGGHVPPGPGDLAILMHHFENWLNSEQTVSLHPVKHAALAHYKLVHIHPFIDGNGRTSRLLMNALLMRAGYPPIIIPKQQRHKYYQFLQVANEGDIRPFVRFIADCTEKTLDLYLWATSDLPHQIPMLARTENELAFVDKLVTPVESTESAAKTQGGTQPIDVFASGSGDIP